VQLHSRQQHICPQAVWSQRTTLPHRFKHVHLLPAFPKLQACIQTSLLAWLMCVAWLICFLLLFSRMGQASYWEPGWTESDGWQLRNFEPEDCNSLLCCSWQVMHSSNSEQQAVAHQAISKHIAAIAVYRSTDTKYTGCSIKSCAEAKPIKQVKLGPERWPCSHGQPYMGSVLPQDSVTTWGMARSRMCSRRSCCPNSTQDSLR